MFFLSFFLIFHPYHISVWRDHLQKDISTQAETAITICLVNINTYIQNHHSAMNIKSDPLTAAATCMNTLKYLSIIIISLFASKKVKVSLWQAVNHRVVRCWGSTFSRQSAQRWRWGCQAYAPASRPLPPGRFLVLISVRGWVTPGPQCGWKY
jgi:hypothetical protein